LSQGLTEGLSDEDAARLFEEGKELASCSGEPAQHAFLVYRYGIYRGLVGGAVEDWISLSVEALRLAEEAGDPAVEFYIRMGLAMGLDYAGRLRDALTLCNEALARTDDPHFATHLTGRSPYIFLLLQRGSALGEMGRLSEAKADLDRAIALARENEYLLSLSSALFARILRAELVGERGTALADAQELVRLAEQTGSSATRLTAQAGLAIVHSLTGSPAAVQLLEEAAQGLGEFVRISPLRAARGLVTMSRLLLVAEDPDRARAVAEQATDSARDLTARTTECFGQITLAEALRRTEGASAGGAIRSALARARSLVEETEARAYEPWILEEEGRLAHLEGDNARVEKKLREAHRLFLEMGATGHAERLARELGL
jgi:tetratricopeptide (TPR) repeat protein